MILRDARTLPAEFGWVKRAKKLSFPVDSDLCRRLGDHLPNMVWDEELLDFLGEQADRVARLRTMAEREDVVPHPDPRLWAYQRVGIDWAVEINRGLIADEQGMGKTVQALVAASYYAPSRALIICSKAKMNDWLEHAEEWTSIPATKLQGDAFTRSDLISNWDGFLICNYKTAQMHWKELVRSDHLIVDEAHKLRNRKTAQTKAVFKIAGYEKPVLLLTASPSMNTASDWWPLLHILDPRRFSGYWAFAYRFLSVKNNGFGVDVGEVRPEEKDRLQAILDQYMLRRPATMLKAMPDMKRWLEPHEMGEQQRGLYDEMEESGVATHKGVELRSEGALSQITRMRQLALSPRLVFPEYRGPDKIDTLIDFLSGRDGQTIVFSMLAEMVALTALRLEDYGIRCSLFTGKQTDKQQTEHVAAFKAGRTDVLCATHGTGGEGHNFPNAKRVVYLDLAWHPDGNKQAQRRIVRPGQTATEVEIVMLHTTGSVEDTVNTIVRDKIPVTVEEIMRRQDG